MESYYEALKQWLKDFIKEPHVVIFGSLLFVVLAIPVITTGIALAIVVSYSKYSVEGRVFKLKHELGAVIKKYWLKATILWFLDLIAILLFLGSLYMLLFSGEGVIFKGLYAVLLISDLVFIASFVYQFPMLVFNEFKLSEVVLKSMVMCVENLSVTLMVLCVMLLIVIVTALTGVGLFVILPGAAVLFMVHVYKNVVLKYVEDEEQ